MLMMLLSLATRAAGRGSGGCEANRAHHLSTGVGAALPILTVESLLSTKLFLPWYKDTDARVIVITEPRSFLDILFTSVERRQTRSGSKYIEPSRCSHCRVKHINLSKSWRTRGI